MAVTVLIALLGALGIGYAVRTDEQALACRTANENKAVIRSLIDAVGGPEIIEPPATRARVLRLLEPAEC